MTFEQHIIDNDDDRFPGHQLIVGVQDGVEVWRSWAPEEVPIECRLNLDVPTALDQRSGAPKGQTVRWKMPDAAVADTLDIDHAALKQEAQARGLDTKTEAQLRHPPTDG